MEELRPQGEELMRPELEQPAALSRYQADLSIVAFLLHHDRDPTEEAALHIFGMHLSWM